MNGIILQEQNGKILASSREVAEKFEKRHDHVMRDIDTLLIDSPKLGNELFIESSYTNSRGKEYRCFDMTRDGFSLLCMGFTGKKALQWKLKFLEAFNAMEKRLKELSEPQDSYLIEDPAARARRWAEEYEEKQRIEQENVKLLEVNDQLQTENDEMRPKAKFHDDIRESENCILLGEFAAILQNNHHLNIGQNKLFKFCRENNILCSSKNHWNKPYQRMIDKGYFQIRETPYERNGKIYTSQAPVITGKGQIWLTNLLLKEFEN